MFLQSQVFGFTLLSVELFALFPTVRPSVHRRGRAARVSLTVIFAAAALCLVAVNSAALAVIFGLVLMAVTIVCPAVLCRLHSVKFHITGPWDIAHVETADAD